MTNTDTISNKFIDLLSKEFKSFPLNSSMNTNDQKLFEEKFKLNLKTFFPFLLNWNGQKEKTPGIFFDFLNHSSGTILWHYCFLKSNEIIDLYDFIQIYTNGKLSKELIPFAKCSKEVGDKGSIGFAIHSQTGEIYKVKFYEYDRFVTVYEFGEEKVNAEFSDFLSNQCLWREMQINKTATNKT